MHHIGAGEAELHRRACRYPNAERHEIILLGDDPHRDRTVGLDSGAEIALDKLAMEMKGLRLDDFDIAGRVQRTDDAGRHNDAIMTTSIATMTMSQRFSVRATISSGTMPPVSCRRSGFDDGSSNGASRHEQEEIEGQPTDEEQPDGSAGDNKRADRPLAECLRRLIRSDRRGDVLGRVRSGVVCFVELHWDQSFGCAAAGAEE